MFKVYRVLFGLYVSFLFCGCAVSPQDACNNIYSQCKNQIPFGDKADYVAACSAELEQADADTLDCLFLPTKCMPVVECGAMPAANADVLKAACIHDCTQCPACRVCEMELEISTCIDDCLAAATVPKFEALLRQGYESCGDSYGCEYLGCIEPLLTSETGEKLMPLSKWSR